jgi:molybdate transport system substrate-binding protein
LSYGASSDLATQIVNGAPADVFASANVKQMKVVADTGKVAGESKPFTSNVLTIVVPPGNPKGIRSFADLAKPDVTELVCAPQVPCGAAALKALKAAGLTVKPVSQEQDVKAALTKVRLNEADAALVYRTDVKAAGGQVRGIDFPEAAQAINDYPIVALKNAPNPAGAAAFVAYVRSEPAQQVLAGAGFQQP